MTATPSRAGANRILLFASIHHVLAAEQALKQQAVCCDLIPVPRDLHSDCGMVLALGADDWPAARAALEALSTPRPRLFAIAANGPRELSWEP